jgi:hypothetical protein
MYRRSSLFLLAWVLVAVGCDDVQNPAGPPAELPAAKISDGRFVGGNDDFFFLPPLLPDPKGTANYDAAGFNARLGPTVSVCRLAANPLTNPATDCALDASNKPILVASFSSSQISVGTDQYHVNWQTDDSNLVIDRFYRLQVFLGSVRIGFADIDPVSNARDLKNANTGEVIPLVDGRTLPIKFRIENGVLCSTKADCGEFKVTNTGGTFFSNTKDAGVQFKPGFLPAGVTEVTLKIERVTVGSNNSCHGAAGARLWKEFEGCYNITTDPDLRPYGGIQQPAIAAQCVEVSPQDPLFEFLQPYKSNNGGELQRLTNVAQTFLDCEGFTGSTASAQPSNPLMRYAAAGVRHLGAGLGKVFGVQTLNAIDLGLGEEIPIGGAFSRFSWAIGLAASIADGDDQSVGFGLPVADPLEVHVRSLHFHPSGEEGDHPDDIAGVAVRFTVTEGDGYFELSEAGSPVRTKDVLTNADGLAIVNFIADANGEENVVTAATPTLDPGMALATYSIPGLPPDLLVENLTRSIAAPNTSNPLSWTFSIRNIGTGVAVPSVARVLVTLEEEGSELVTTYDVPVPRLNPGAAATLSTPVLAPTRDVGDHRVVVTANATSVVVEANVENNTATQDFTVSPASGNVVGSVTDAATGDPLSGALVTLVGTNVSATADCAGDFLITNVPAGTYTVRATFNGYLPQTLTGVVLPGDGPLALALVPAPTIDGVMSQGEWDGAATFGPFAVTLPGGRSTTATIYMKNTATQLLTAIHFSDDLSSETNVYAALRMDTNANGIWDNGEDGWVVQQRNDGVRISAFFDEFFSCNVEPCQGQLDQAWGGTSDGVAASTDSDIPTVIEIAKGINTSDARDASLVFGQTLRFFMHTNIGAPLIRTDLLPGGVASYTIR